MESRHPTVTVFCERFQGVLRGYAWSFQTHSPSHFRSGPPTCLSEQTDFFHSTSQFPVIFPPHKKELVPEGTICSRRSVSDGIGSQTTPTKQRPTISYSKFKEQHHPRQLPTKQLAFVIRKVADSHLNDLRLHECERQHRPQDPPHQTEAQRLDQARDRAPLPSCVSSCSAIPPRR